VQLSNCLSENTSRRREFVRKPYLAVRGKKCAVARLQTQRTAAEPGGCQEGARCALGTFTDGDRSYASCSGKLLEQLQREEGAEASGADGSVSISHQSKKRGCKRRCSEKREPIPNCPTSKEECAGERKGPAVARSNTETM